jgi:hypothetical protein
MFELTHGKKFGDWHELPTSTVDFFIMIVDEIAKQTQPNSRVHVLHRNKQIHIQRYIRDSASKPPSKQQRNKILKILNGIRNVNPEILVFSIIPLGHFCTVYMRLDADQ